MRARSGQERFVRSGGTPLHRALRPISLRINRRKIQTRSSRLFPQDSEASAPSEIPGSASVRIAPYCQYQRLPPLPRRAEGTAK